MLFDSEERGMLKWMVVILVFATIISVGAWLLNRSADVVDTGITRYEEFHEIARTAEQINTNLCQMRALPDKDPMFAQFSKAQRINQLQAQLNRWVEEYNAKSKMINRSLWKSSELPYQLDVAQFKCYGDKQ
jgi:hypothetical protein